MKKITLYILGLSIAIAGCKKNVDDSIEGLTADQRLSAALKQYQTILTQAPFGWKMVEQSGVAYNGGASDSIKATFTYYMQFTDSNSVKMYGDFDTTQASVAKTSGWRIKALQRPTILFDTYSYIHVPCDPDPSVSKSPLDAGLGWGTDFQFQFADNVSPDKLGDTIRLTGLTNGAAAYMVRATKAESDAYNAGELKNSMIFERILNYYKKVTIGSTIFEITPGTFPRTVTFKYLDGAGVLQSILSSPYYLTTSGINFVTPFTVNGTVIKSIDNINFNVATNSATCSINGTASTIAGTIASIKTDLTSPSRWWNYAVNNGNSYWISYKGFHANGVDDAFGIQKLTNFYYYIYWPKYSTTLDYFVPIILSGSSLALNSYYTRAKSPPTFTTDGKAVFVLSANTGTIPAGSAVANSNALLYNANGFYFVQTSATTYDMVSASDAKSWITWQW